MKKPAVWIAAAAVAIALSALLWRTVISPPPYIEITPLSYSDYASWSVIPKEQPAPVWTDGWAVDVFLVNEASGLKAHSGKGLDKREQRARLRGRLLEDGLSVVGPVYAPMFRTDAIGDDLSRAFESYLKQHNRGRAFIIASDTALPPSLLAFLDTEPDLNERFGGFYRLSPAKGSVALVETGDATAKPLTSYCGAHLVDDGTCVVDVGTARQGGYKVLAENSGLGAAPVTPFVDWLKANAAPMAEPLGDLEEVEIVDIRKPGDTDERRTKKKKKKRN